MTISKEFWEAFENYCVRQVPKWMQFFLDMVERHLIKRGILPPNDVRRIK